MIKTIYRFASIMTILILLLMNTNFDNARAASGGFVVSNGKLYAPTGEQFIFKGVSAFYGTFSGGDAKNYGVGRTNYTIATKALDYQKSIGINTIRIFASVPGTNYHTTEYLPYYGTVENFKQKLLDTVTLVRAKGFVVEISPAHGEGSAETAAWLSYLGQTYKNDPYVLIGTMNEPRCSTSTSYYDWACWYGDQQKFVPALRNAGYTNPIIIDSISWSSDLSKVTQYPLNDSQLIYAVHRYGNDNATLTDALKADYNKKWANLAATSPFPMFIEEVGNHNGYLDFIVWLSQFIDWSTDWVNNRGGDGIIAFTWYWSDGNKMTNYNPPQTDAGLNEWGNIFKNQYLAKVNSVPNNPIPPTSVATASITPTATMAPTFAPTSTVSQPTAIPTTSTSLPPTAMPAATSVPATAVPTLPVSATSTTIPPTVIFQQATAAVPLPTKIPATATTAPAARSGFVVSNGKIADPNGQPFTVKGVVSVYGAFSGGDAKGYGKTNYTNAQRDFGLQKALGVNVVRIYVAIPNSDYYKKNYASYYGTVDKYKAAISKIVALGRGNGFVVYLSPAHGANTPETLEWLRYLGATYKNDPYVWLGAMDEPNCGGTDCSNWVKWQSDHKTYVSTIRSSGYNGPIVINTVSWSSDLSKMDQYPLGDSNLIYGVHRFGDNNATMTDALKKDYDAKWAGLAANSKYAMIIDSVGNYKASSLNSIDWLKGFIDYGTDWVYNRGGDGAIAFNWYWSDGNKMTNKSGELNQWGNIFKNQYLVKANTLSAKSVAPTVMATASITPTVSSTPTVAVTNTTAPTFTPTATLPQPTAIPTTQVPTSVPSTPVLVSPSSTLSQASWSNTFSWTGVSGVTMYSLTISTADGTITYVNAPYVVGSGVTCDAGLNCTLSPAETASLPVGSYRWNIQPSTATANGMWTEYMYFTIQ